MSSKVPDLLALARSDDRAGEALAALHREAAASDVPELVGAVADNTRPTAIREEIARVVLRVARAGLDARVVAELHDEAKDEALPDRARDRLVVALGCAPSAPARVQVMERARRLHGRERLDLLRDVEDAGAPAWLLRALVPLCDREPLDWVGPHGAPHELAYRQSAAAVAALAQRALGRGPAPRWDRPISDEEIEELRTILSALSD